MSERLTRKTMFGDYGLEDCPENVQNKLMNKLGQLEDFEEKLGIDLTTFLKGIDPDTCFMRITKDKKFDFCGDAYYGTYSKEGLLQLIQELLFMYWELKKGA